MLGLTPSSSLKQLTTRVSLQSLDDPEATLAFLNGESCNVSPSHYNASLFGRAFYRQHYFS